MAQPNAEPVEDYEYVRPWIATSRWKDRFRSQTDGRMKKPNLAWQNR